MIHRQTHECAARLRIPPRTAFADQVGQAQQAVRAGRNCANRRVAHVPDLLQQPITRAAGRLHRAHGRIQLRMQMMKREGALLRIKDGRLAGES